MNAAHALRVLFPHLSLLSPALPLRNQLVSICTSGLPNNIEVAEPRIVGLVRVYFKDGRSHIVAALHLFVSNPGSFVQRRPQRYMVLLDLPIA